MVVNVLKSPLLKESRAGLQRLLRTYHRKEPAKSLTVWQNVFGLR